MHYVPSNVRTYVHSVPAHVVDLMWKMFLDEMLRSKIQSNSIYACTDHKMKWKNKKNRVTLSSRAQSSYQWVKIFLSHTTHSEFMLFHYYSSCFFRIFLFFGFLQWKILAQNFDISDFDISFSVFFSICHFNFSCIRTISNAMKCVKAIIKMDYAIGKCDAKRKSRFFLFAQFPYSKFTFFFSIFAFNLIRWQFHSQFKCRPSFDCVSN